MKRFITVTLAVLALMLTMTACANRGNVAYPRLRDGAPTHRTHNGYNAEHHRRHNNYNHRRGTNDGVVPHGHARDGVVRDGMRRDGVRHHNRDGVLRNDRNTVAVPTTRPVTPNNRAATGIAPLSTVPVPKATTSPQAAVTVPTPAVSPSPLAR